LATQPDLLTKTAPPTVAVEGPFVPKLPECRDTKNPTTTKVEEGLKLPESGRPDSNRRRPAWDASDPSADQRPPA
jgi:hypothetical protein